MFKGTKRLAKGAIDELTTWNGGVNNAFTGRDYTVYYFSFASDRWLPYNVPEANMDTRATLEDGYWTINGRKHYISNGYDASLYVVYANTNPRSACNRARVVSSCRETHPV